MRTHPYRIVVLVAAAMAATIVHGAQGQVQISMPPPPNTSTRVADDAPPATVQTTGSLATTIEDIPAVAPLAASVTEGEVALARYAYARTGTYDTYFNDGSYWNNGIRYISYPNYIPQFYWGPFWGGVWPGWSWGGCW